MTAPNPLFLLQYLQTKDSRLYDYLRLALQKSDDHEARISTLEIPEPVTAVNLMKNPPDLFDDFINGSIETGEIGNLGWDFTNGTPLKVAAVANHPGLFRYTSAAVAGTISNLYLGDVTSKSYLIDQIDNFYYVLRPPRLAAVTTVDVRFGIAEAPAVNPPAHWIGYEYIAATDTTYHAVTRVGGVQTRTNTNIVYTGNGIFHNFRVWIENINSVRFITNGYQVANHSTNIPVTGTQMEPFLQIIPTAAVGRGIEIDAFWLTHKPLVR